jgi:hypothetical protein
MDVETLHRFSPSGQGFGALMRRFAGGSRRARRRAATAIFSQIAKQRIHSVEPRGIDHRSAIAAYGDQSGFTKPIEMEGQGIWRKPERRGDFARSQTVPPGLHEQAVSIKAVFLGKGRQGSKYIGLFHISIIIEMME